MFRSISIAAANVTATPARLSAPKPVVGSADRTMRPVFLGLHPTQIGTVSMCAVSIRRGDLIVPGILTIKFPTSPLIGVFLCALSNRIQASFAPADFNWSQMNRAHAPSSPLFPGIASSSISRDSYVRFCVLRFFFAIVIYRIAYREFSPSYAESRQFDTTDNLFKKTSQTIFLSRIGP